MSLLADDDVFVHRTHKALADLKLEADKVRRNRPTHHACSDDAPCTNCDALRLNVAL